MHTAEAASNGDFIMRLTSLTSGPFHLAALLRRHRRAVLSTHSLVLSVCTMAMVVVLLASLQTAFV